MATVEVFDPPMCCSTGVCGLEPGENLTRFAADLNWLKSHGVQVHRYNLAQEPARFTANPRVKQVVAALGVEGLPIVVIDGDLVSQGEYPSRPQLLKMIKLAVGSGEHIMAQELLLPQVPQACGCSGGEDGNRCC